MPYNIELPRLAQDTFLEIARGNIPGQSTVNKFGRAPNGVQTAITDIWDRADAAEVQKIWIAPTQARTHQIVSTSTSDDGSPVGVGARTIEIFGLTSWAAEEVSEIITMNGTTDVPTVNAYVIIHLMRVVTKGATNINVGIITATADTDTTVTAQINVGAGYTHMAIYGIPSIQKLYIGRLYGNVNKSAGATGQIDISLEINPEPDAELLHFGERHTFGISTAGTSALTINYYVPKIIDGPAIIKVQGIASVADLDVSAGFDGVLVTE